MIKSEIIKKRFDKAVLSVVSGRADMVVIYACMLDRFKKCQSIANKTSGHD